MVLRWCRWPGGHRPVYVLGRVRR